MLASAVSPGGRQKHTPMLFLEIKTNQPRRCENAVVIREFRQVLNPSGGLVLVGQRGLSVRVRVLIRGNLTTFTVLVVILLALRGAVFIFGFVVFFGFGRIHAITAIQRRQFGFDN